MNIVELEEHHLRAIELREIEREDIGDNLSEDYIQHFMSSTFKRAVIDQGKVVMVMGGFVHGDLCRTWLLANSIIEKNPVASIKAILKVQAEGLKHFPDQTYYTLNVPGQDRVMKYLNRIGYFPAGTTIDEEDGKERIIMVKRSSNG